MRIIVHGAAGRMGKKIHEMIGHDSDLFLVGLVDPLFADEHSAQIHNDAGVKTSSDLADCPQADLIIDFSSDEGAAAAAVEATQRRSALLVATTALSLKTREKIESAARTAPVLVAANTSIGANLLAELARRAASSAGEEAEAAIIETHHRRKRDAPSGTALLIAELMRQAGCPLPDERILSLRQGDVPGEHMVRFAWEGEILELRHAVNSRDVFAAGALRAGRWLVGQAPGMYTMADVLAESGR